MSDMHVSADTGGSPLRQGASATELAAAVDARRKAGELAAAGALLAAHRGRHAGSHLIGIAAARLALMEGDPAMARLELMEAARLSPGHPWIAELLAGIGSVPGNGIGQDELVDLIAVGGDPAVGPGADGEDATANDEELDPGDMVTPSLAALYRQQGHLDQALAAYTRLANQNPDDHSLATSRDELEAEIAASAPLPFAAQAAGGESVGALMARIVAGHPEVSQPREGSFDSFFGEEGPPAGPDPDYDAFRRWLEGLDR